MRSICILSVLLFSVFGMRLCAQNIFHNRSFWATNPAIPTIEKNIAQGNSPTALNPNGFDAVTYAILADAPLKTIKYLLAIQGNSVSKYTHDKRTYVFWAAYKGNVALMRYLIKNKSRMDLKDAHHFSVLTFAAATGQTNKQIYELCIEHGIAITKDVDQHGANALLLALSSTDDLSFITYLRSKGLSLFSTDIHGSGAFSYASVLGNTAVLDYIKQQGVLYKKSNNKGENAMFFAAKGTRKGYPSLSFFQYLEALHIPLHSVNNKGESPIHYLSYSNKDKKTFAYFIEKGADLNQVDQKGNIPLTIAAKTNTLEVIKLLTRSTKNIHHTNKKGNTALTHAVIANNADVVAYFLQQQLDVNQKDNKANTLAYYLVKGYHPKKEADFLKKLTLLTQAGLDFTSIQSQGNTIFHTAIEKNSISLLQEIRKLKVPLHIKNKQGLTPLHLAIMQAKDTRLIQYLLQIGADPFAVTALGETVYDLAQNNELLQRKNIDIQFLKPYQR